MNNKEHIIFNYLLQQSIKLNENEIYEYCTSEDLLQFLLNYKSKDIVIYQDNIIELTENGFNWLVKNKKSVFLKKKVKTWERIPPQYKIQNESISIWTKVLK